MNEEGKLNTSDEIELRLMNMVAPLQEIAHDINIKLQRDIGRLQSSTTVREMTDAMKQAEIELRTLSWFGGITNWFYSWVDYFKWKDSQSSQPLIAGIDNVNTSEEPWQALIEESKNMGTLLDASNQQLEDIDKQVVTHDQHLKTMTDTYL